MHVTKPRLQLAFKAVTAADPDFAFIVKKEDPVLLNIVFDAAVRHVESSIAETGEELMMQIGLKEGDHACDGTFFAGGKFRMPGQKI